LTEFTIWIEQTPQYDGWKKNSNKTEKQNNIILKQRNHEWKKPNTYEHHLFKENERQK